jgi:hypothetical protein
VLKKYSNFSSTKNLFGGRVSIFHKKLKVSSLFCSKSLVFLRLLSPLSFPSIKNIFGGGGNLVYKNPPDEERSIIAFRRGGRPMFYNRQKDLLVLYNFGV